MRTIANRIRKSIDRNLLFLFVCIPLNEPAAKANTTQNPNGMKDKKKFKYNDEK